jgi:hypothetical protein
LVIRCNGHTKTNRDYTLEMSLTRTCTHEAEWTPFQTHYFSENVVAERGMEPRSLDLYRGTLTTRLQMWSKRIYITHILKYILWYYIMGHAVA